MDEPIIDVECNVDQEKNCSIRLDYVFCDGYREGKSIGAFSHFHEDHIGAVYDCTRFYDVLITHPITFEGIVALKPGMRLKEQWVPQNYGVKYHTTGGHIELLKANHIPGSSQIYVESGGKTLLYSGDFSFPDVQIKHADYLVLDATHGDPWYDGRTDRRSVKNRMFEDIQEKLESNKSVLIQTSAGTLQELIRHFEIGYGRKLPSDIEFVMDRKQENVLKNIYKDERHEFRPAVEYDSREFWKLMRTGQRCIVFSTSLILPDDLNSFYKIISDKFRFTKEQSPILPSPDGKSCRYNLASHASIQDIYRYVESVDPKFIVTDRSRSEYAKKLAKLLEQKFPNIKAAYRPAITQSSSD